MSERDNEKTQRIRKALDENLEIVNARSVNETQSRKFSDGFKRLCVLVTDHPFYKAELKRIRNEYKLPENGFLKAGQAFQWELASKARRKRFDASIERLVSSFEIARVFQAGIRQFVHDDVLIPRRTATPSINSYPLYSIVKTTSDRDVNKYLINKESTYIEIFSWTTKRDVENALKRITKTRDEQLHFKVSKVGDLTRYVWMLSESGLTDKQISKEVQGLLTKSGAKRIFGYEDVPVYRSRYKRSLNTLRRI